ILDRQKGQSPYSLVELRSGKATRILFPPARSLWGNLDLQQTTDWRCVLPHHAAFRPARHSRNLRQEPSTWLCWDGPQSWKHRIGGHSTQSALKKRNRPTASY